MSTSKQLGLTLYCVKVNWPIIGVDGYNVHARTPDQAWAKFVAQQYRNSPLKPDRREWTITTVEDNP